MSAMAIIVKTSQSQGKSLFLLFVDSFFESSLVLPVFVDPSGLVPVPLPVPDPFSVVVVPSGLVVVVPGPELFVLDPFEFGVVLGELLLLPLQLPEPVDGVGVSVQSES